MNLFKRILLSLFPDEMMANNINPASMFISFISTKEFFSVINRKIIENFRLNLFDIAIDPFEFKIGFGDKQQLKPKDIDMYYGYCGVANMNGYRFFNVANTSNSISLIVSIYTKDIFKKYPEEYFLNFLYATYLLAFVFFSRIKVFNKETKQDDYNRFVEVFFSFYKFIFDQTAKNLDIKEFNSIKKELLGQIEIFFLLYYYYKNLNTILYNKEISNQDFYGRLLYDELKNNQIKLDIQNFIDKSKNNLYSTKFGKEERIIFQSIFPVDILLKYLFLDNNIFLIIENIISKLYDKKTLDNLLKSFRKNGNQLEDLILYITNYKNFKKNFFSGVQKYMVTFFKYDKNSETDEEIEDFMSSVGEDIENIEGLKIPERIKKESKIMEKILNFYITFIGGFWISRGDSFFIRSFRKDLIDDILRNDSTDDTKLSLYYYGTLLYNYGKNIFYYKYTTENLRQGKQRFFLPYKNTSKEIYSNLCIIKEFEETFISTLFQEINPKDIKIYLKTTSIIKVFKDNFSKDISRLVKQKDEEFINEIYGDIAVFLTKGSSFIEIIKNNLTTKDIYNIKENIYCFNFWLSKCVYKQLSSQNIKFNKDYSDNVILSIFSTIKESLFGFLLYIKYLELKNIQIETLIDIYISDILNINKKYHIIFKDTIKILLKNFHDLLNKRTEIDDNKEFFELLGNNRIKFVQKRDEIEVRNSLIGEDIIRFKGLLKNITYYNKRFIIPNP